MPTAPTTVERRQWRRLLGLSYGRLMDAALASREVAAEYFAIWSAAAFRTFCRIPWEKEDSCV